MLIIMKLKQNFMKKLDNFIQISKMNKQMKKGLFLNKLLKKSYENIITIINAWKILSSEKLK